MAPAKPDTTLAFKIGDDRFEVDLDDLEFGEVEMLEEAFDQPFDQVDLTRMKAMRILVFIAMRRKNPRVTMEDVSGLKVTAFEAEDEKPERPTKAGKAKAAK